MNEPRRAYDNCAQCGRKITNRDSLAYRVGCVHRGQRFNLPKISRALRKAGYRVHKWEWNESGPTARIS